MLPLLILLVVAYETKGIGHLTIGQSIQGLTSKEENNSLYYFYVPDMKNSTDLVIMVKTFNPLADPNIYISRLNDNPISAKDGEVLVCEAKGTDSCVLQRNQVQPGEALYLAVVSTVPCEFSIRIDLDEELKLYRDDFLLFKMNSTQQSQIISFDVGELHGLENEIQIIFSVRNVDSLEEPFQAYMNKAENGIPNNEKYDYIAKDLQDNKVIEIKKHLLNSSQKYFILLQAQQGAMFQVQSFVNNETKKINFWEIKQQVVEEGDYDFYVLDLLWFKQERREIIQITLTPFQGYASLYVNPNKQPPLLQNYLWSGNNKFGDVVTIGNKDLKDIKLKSLFIAVYGEQFCTYQLQIIYQYSESSEYLAQSVLNCRRITKENPLKLIIQYYQIKDSTIQVNFKRIVGNSNFIITNYQQYQKIQTEIDHLIQHQNDYEASPDHVFFYSKKQNIDNFRLFCEKEIEQILSIYVYLGEQETRSEGKVCVSYHIIEDLYILQENTPHKSQIDIEISQYYKFVVQDNDPIQNLQFIVTPITGQVTLYVSQTKQHPNSSNYDEFSINNIINIAEITGSKPQPGAYFISVFGNTSSKYTITVLVKRDQNYQFGQYAWHYIQLSQGEPQKNEMEVYDVALYKIDFLQFQNINNGRSSVIISLFINYGEFIIYGFDKPETDVSKCIWKQKKILHIRDDDPNYPEILYLRIELSSRYEGFFDIVYQFENQQIWLYSGSYHMSLMEAEEIQYFIYEFKMNETFILVKNENFFNSPVILEIHDEEKYEITYSKSKVFAQIRLKNSENYQCPDYMNKCAAQFQFELRATNQSYQAIIILDLQDNELQLYDSQPLTKNLPLVEDHFYFYTNRKEISIICFSSIRTKMTILAKFVQNMDEPYPSQEKEDYHKQSQQFSFSYYSSLYFSEKEIATQSCRKACLIKLTIISEYIQGIKHDFSTEGYTIQLDQGAILLFEGNSRADQIQEVGILYYKVQLFEDDKNLIILLTPLQYCNVDLLVSKNNLPQQEKADWKSTDHLSDSLIIQAGNKIHPEMAGDYFIGVFGEQNCQFAIQYSVGQIQMYDIYFNVPQKFQLKEGEVVYLKLKIYENYYEPPFQFFITSFSNTAIMFVEELDWQNYSLSYLTKELVEFQYNNTGKGYNDYLEVTQKEKMTDFIIAIRGYYLEDVTIQVNYNDDIRYLQPKALYKSHIQLEQVVLFNLNNDNQENMTLWLNVQRGKIEAFYVVSKDEPFSSDSNKNLEIHKEFYKNKYFIKTPNSFLGLKIIGLQESFFTIQFYSGDGNYKTLHSIDPDYFNLRARENFGYTFNSNFYNESVGNSDQIIFSVTVSIIIGSEIETNGKYKNAMPEVTVYAKNKNQNVMYSVYQATDSLLYLEYIECDTSYNIIISSNSQIDQTGFIEVSAFDVRPLFPQLKYIQSEKVHQSTYWQLKKIQRTTLTLFYDLQFCGGLFQVFLSTDLEKLRNGQYDQQIQTQNNRVVQGYLDLYKFLYQELYFKITPYKVLNKEGQSPSYTLKILLSNRIQVPYQNILPGEYGDLQHSIQKISDTVNLQVSFAELNYTNQLTCVVDKIEYYLLVQEREEMDDEKFNYCVFPNQGRKAVFVQSNRSQQITLQTEIANDKLLRQNNYVITILAKAHVILEDEQKIQLDYYYDSKHVRWNNDLSNQSTSYQVYVIIIIIFVVALIILLKYLGGRRKEKYEASQNQTQLNSEIELKYRGMQN